MGMEVGHTAAGTLYVAADGHMSGDERPHLFATDDFGATWRSLSGDLPEDLFVRTIREDPRDADVLYTGTQRGVWVSFDRGVHWNDLRLNMPASAVYDLEIQPDRNDLIVGTHGRGVWILDDLTPLQQLAAARGRPAVIFPPRPAYRMFAAAPINNSIYAPGAPVAPETGAIGAMRRIITDAEDPVEAGRRFQEMVQAGIERFNEGSLPQAVSMLELAERLTTEKKVDVGTVEIVRRRLGETLDEAQLKKFAEKTDQHANLRKVLQFFTGLRPEGLLEQLPGEQKRDRRRLFLALLEVHGAPARAAAFEDLSRVPGTAVDEQEWFFRRNLVYLLRRIPRGAEASAEEESDVVLRHAQLGLPLLLVKEAVATLAQYKDERTEQGLTQLLFELEAMLAKPEEALYEAKDLRALLDRVAATLGKLPAPRARRALIEHAGKKVPQLGDTIARISELGAQDMSEDTETVDQLLALLKANLPFKLLGMTLRQNDQSLVRIIEALASTPTPAVRRALEEIASKFTGQDAGKAAAKALAGFDRPKAAPVPPSEAAPAEMPMASLQGDLEVFGLPALLQSLAESSASGSLTLRGPKGGEQFASLTMREGKLTEIQRGHLRGEDAFYQLLERPLPGQFAFVKGPVPEKPGATPREILPLTLEAMRRYDELQEAAVLVPDTVFLERTDVAATPHPTERDGSFLQALWERASQGATPVDCEAVVPSDSYRIRRALAHWVEQGALKIRG